MRPSVEQAKQWKPSHLEVRADYARTLAAAALDGRSILSEGRETLIGSWQGAAADAAGDHADAEMRAAAVVADAFEELAETLSGANRAIDGALQVVLNAINNVGDDFEVTDTHVIPKAGATDPAVAEAEAAAHAEAINAALDTLGAIDDEQAGAIRGALARLGDAIAGPAGVGGAEGELLAEITSDGHITHEDLQRLRAGFDAAGITPEYMGRLLRGEQVHDLPHGSVEFLKTYFDDVGVAGFLEVQAALAAHGGEDARVMSAQLGDGLLALSHERIGDVSGGRGGYSALPQSVRAIPEGGAVPGFGGSSPFRHANAHGGWGSPKLALADKFWGEVGKGIAPPGTKLGSMLITSAANHALYFGPEHGGVKAEQWFDEDFGGEGLRVENTGQAMLDISSRNHDSVTSVLTGDHDGDASTPSVSRDDILNPLFRREWGDDGAALGKNLSWMTEGLNAEPGSEEWKRAGTASFALAQYISHEEHYDDFMDMKGEHSENIGEVNPHLVRSMEQGLRGTIGYLTEAPITELPGWGVPDSSAPLPLESDHSTSGRYDHAKRVATVLSTDIVSNTNLSAEISRLVDARLENSDQATATEAGKLVGLNEHAEFTVHKEMVDDGGISSQEAYEKRREAYDFVIDEASGLAKGPLSGLIDHGVSFGGEAARESVIGPEVTYDAEKNVDANSDDENSIKALHSAVNAALSSGRLNVEDLSGYTHLTDEQGNLHGLEKSEMSGNSSKIKLELQAALDASNGGFDYDRRGDFKDGYSAIRTGPTN